MQLTFAQVEHVLSQCQNIREERRSAFANRLKNYQKAEFPAGINTGRGRAASYGVGHLWQLAVALELNQLGLAPERAIAVIRANMAKTIEAAAFASKGGAPKGRIASPICLFFDPAALDDLVAPGGSKWRSQKFDAGSIAYAKRVLGERMVDENPRLVFLNISALVYSLATWGRPTFGMSLGQFYSVFSDWAMGEAGLDGSSQA